MAYHPMMMNREIKATRIKSANSQVQMAMAVVSTPKSTEVPTVTMVMIIVTIEARKEPLKGRGTKERSLRRRRNNETVSGEMKTKGIFEMVFGKAERSNRVADTGGTELIVTVTHLLTQTITETCQKKKETHPTEECNTLLLVTTIRGNGRLCNCVPTCVCVCVWRHKGAKFFVSFASLQLFLVVVVVHRMWLCFVLTCVFMFGYQPNMSSKGETVSSFEKKNN